MLFRRKQKPSDAELEQKINHAWENQWERIKQRYPIGKQFNYIGRTMIVVSHTEYKQGITRDGWIPSSPAILPSLNCEYVDNAGKLHEWYFPVDMFDLVETL